MAGSLIVSILALLIAVSSLALALRADRRAGRAEARGRTAYLAVEPGASSSISSGRRFTLHVRNVGSAVARDARIWLEDESGRIVSIGPAGNAPTLAPGEDPVAIELTVGEVSLPPPPVSFSVWMSWSDPAGRQERISSGVTVST